MSSVTGIRSSQPETLVIVVSQSGETADTLAALRVWHKSQGSRVLGIVNVVGSSIAREADNVHVYMGRAGDFRGDHQGVQQRSWRPSICCRIKFAQVRGVS